MNKKTYNSLYRKSQAFCRLRGVNDLCSLLNVDKRKLLLISKQPQYKSFSIPKKDGGERHIETPNPSLKRVQHGLNRYLQSVYYFEKSRAAYGFVVGVRNDDDRRNVVSNARKHLKRPYLLNIDLKDFFHTVRKKQVLQIFESQPFGFAHDLPGVLTKLTIYKGRLPMGAPTSPVLSNLACRELDRKILSYAQENEWVYTRYADDISLSSQKEINLSHIAAIRERVEAQQFKVNEKKVNLYGPDDDKIVTGLLLREKVELAPGYLEELQRDLAKLKSVLEVQNFQGELSSKWVDEFKLQARGRVNFAGFVLGKRNPLYLEMKDAYYTAINPPQDEFGAVSWRSFPYNM